MEPFESIPDVLEIWDVAGPEAARDKIPDVLIELPHGATKAMHLDRAKAHARHYPGDRFDKFFFANTDQGSSEYGLHLAECLCNPAWFQQQQKHFSAAFVKMLQERAAGMRVLIVRALLPRTLVDVNRVWELGMDFQSANLTGVVGAYIKEEDEINFFHDRYSQYQATVDRAHALICKNGGTVFNLHTYAPISVGVPKDADIVDVLEAAYQPENYPKFPKRPEVQLISATPTGEMLAPEPLCSELMTHFTEAGFQIKQNDPFNLHPAAACSRRAAQYPGQVVVIEVSRKLLASPFNPFIEMHIDPVKVDRVVKPIALAFLTALTSKSEGF
jgi:hypothetical protein